MSPSEVALLSRDLLQQTKATASATGSVYAISVRQPWAGAIAMFGKNVENRSSWKYRYRGPLLLHSSSGPAYLEDFHAAVALARKAGIDPALLEEELDDPRPVGFWGKGVILGVMDLLDVVNAGSPGARKSEVWDSPWRDPQSATWLHIEHFFPVVPLPYKGRVGLFKVPVEVVNNLTSLLDGGIE